MFAIGGRAFTKRIAQVMGCSFSEAEILKLKYASGKAKGEEHELIKHALASDAEVWLSGTELTLGEFMTGEFLPSRILLCGGGSNLPEIKALLKDTDWYTSLPFAKKPVIQFLEPSEVTMMQDDTGQLTSTQDVTPMALANLALELVDTSGPLDTILNRAIPTAD